MSGAITSAGDYLEALDIFDQGRAEEFILRVINSLTTTGYIYRPARKMRIVMAVFSLAPSFVRTYITDIFKAIQARYADATFMENFSNAFIQMLNIFINNENRFAGYADRGSTRELVTAIAMLLLLTTDKDFPKWGLYRAMLYRYASLFNKANAANTRRLIEKAFDALLEQTDSRLEFTWADLDNITMLCTTRLTAKTGNENPGFTAVYDGAGINLCMSCNSMLIGRSDNMATVKKVLPSKLFPDRDIQILLPRQAQRARDGHGAEHEPHPPHVAGGYRRRHRARQPHYKAQRTEAAPLGRRRGDHPRHRKLPRQLGYHPPVRARGSEL